MCQANEQTQFVLVANIDSKGQVDEANEHNNQAAFFIAKPDDAYCGSKCNNEYFICALLNANQWQTYRAKIR